MKINCFARVLGINNEPSKNQFGHLVIAGDLLLEALLQEEQVDAATQVQKFKLSQRVYDAMDAKLRPAEGGVPADVPESAEIDLSPEDALLLKNLVSRKFQHPIIVARLTQMLDG